MPIVAERLAALDGLVLKAGAHSSWEEGACVLEAVSYVAGEPWSDSPKCASPVIAAFLRKWNDDLPDADRQMLAPLIPRLVGTAADKAVEQRRVWLIVDWSIRTSTAAWLRAAKLDAHADAVAGLPEITGPLDLTPALIATLEDARKASAAAWDAAWAAARAAAWAAARDAARDAAWAAAWAAAWDAAWAAAWDAAWAAARDAARAAAWDAAKSSLAGVVQWLQRSALELVGRLIEAA